MKFEDNLTNEVLLNNRTSNQFELVRDAINLAKHYVLSARDAYYSPESQNIASHVLVVMANGEDTYDDILDDDEEDEEPVVQRKAPPVEKKSREFVNMSDLDKNGRKERLL